MEIGEISRYSRLELVKYYNDDKHVLIFSRDCQDRFELSKNNKCVGVLSFEDTLQIVNQALAVGYEVIEESFI